MTFREMLEESYRVFREKHGEEAYSDLRTLIIDVDDKDVRNAQYQKLLQKKPEYYDPVSNQIVNGFLDDFKMQYLTEKMGVMNISQPEHVQNPPTREGPEPMVGEGPGLNVEPVITKPLPVKKIVKKRTVKRV